MTDTATKEQSSSALGCQTLIYRADGPVARITLNRPQRGNGITMNMPGELARCVEHANLDPAVHVIALDGQGRGFCSGYDLTATAEEAGRSYEASSRNDPPRPDGSPLDPRVIAQNHDPRRIWEPMTDYQMIIRNVRGFMSLFHSEKPVLCKIHGFCVGGGTDMVLCSDLLVVEDDAKIGYPPARVWGSPTTALWAARIGVGQAKRLLLTGDCLSGREAYQWGLASDCAPKELLDERFEALVQRVARLPISQLIMQKTLINQALFAQGLQATQALGMVFDGLSRHTPEGHEFVRHAGEFGWREAVRMRDEPFGDRGASTFKG